MTTAELAFNRLATKELRPLGDVEPPLWHQVLDHIGLFCQYFASTLAIGIIAHQVWRMHTTGRDDQGLGSRWSMTVVGLVFVGLAAITVATSPDEGVSFWFETSFIAIVLVLVLGQLQRGGDLGAKTGLVILAVPLIIHYYGPFAIRFIEGAEAAWSDLPERIRHLGQWFMVLAALATPYCFAPRPFINAAAKLAPLAVATFVSVIGVAIVREQYEVGMRIANQGLGVYIGPGAPTQYLALYLIALGTVTWTLTSCLTADSVARRDIGVGLGLIVVGGYGFAWPIQYLVSIVGLITINDAASRVVDEERGGSQPRPPRFRAPPIADSVWQRFMASVADAHNVELKADEARQGDGEVWRPHRWASVMTSRGEGLQSTTHLVMRRRDINVVMSVKRDNGSILYLNISCHVPPKRAPSWTLYARPEKLLGLGSHPEPPACTAPVVKSGDLAFDERFRVRDAGGLTDVLLDDGLRARAAALIDGWIAFWPGAGLNYYVEPGRGAPLDHPIPITELAFRGTRTTPSIDRLLTVIDLLVDMSRRGLPEQCGDPERD